MNKTRKLALSALFVSIMLILGYIESMIGIGYPGIKLGLSNSVLLLAIYWLGVPTAFMLMAAKVLLSGLMFAGVSAMMYSFAGGILSMLSMALISKIKGVSPVSVGAVGGAMHNVGQVGLAILIVKTTGLLTYMAILMVIGIVMGVITGLLTVMLMKRLPPSMRPSKG